MFIRIKVFLLSMIIFIAPCVAFANQECNHPAVCYDQQILEWLKNSLPKIIPADMNDDEELAFLKIYFNDFGLKQFKGLYLSKEVNKDIKILNVESSPCNNNATGWERDSRMFFSDFEYQNRVYYLALMTETSQSHESFIADEDTKITKIALQLPKHGYYIRTRGERALLKIKNYIADLETRYIRFNAADVLPKTYDHLEQHLKLLASINNQDVDSLENFFTEGAWQEYLNYRKTYSKMNAELLDGYKLYAPKAKATFYKGFLSKIDNLQTYARFQGALFGGGRDFYGCKRIDFNLEIELHGNTDSISSLKVSKWKIDLID